MSIASAYARVSESGTQRETSIDDQFRRCEEVAKREGFVLEERLKFSDTFITGKAEGLAKRAGYQRLIDAIEARECSVVITDEISRLTRNVQEGGRLMNYVDQIGVRFITSDGIDTYKDGWRTMWLAKMMMASVEVESTGHRTKRGMIGQLERGYQIAQAPYGYNAVPDVAATGRVLGTRWVVNEEEAAVVRQMYAWRHAGLSCADIASRLHASGVVPPGAARRVEVAFWRAATVYRLLSNTIYRGVFTWNGSGYTKAIAKRRRKEVVELGFPRSSLRLVSDELWYAVNRRGVAGERAPHGSGKHVFSGLLKCGKCRSKLTLGSGKKNKSIYCPGCQQAVRVGGQTDWIGHSSERAARLALEWVLQQLFTGEVRKELDQRLKDRLNSGPAKEQAELSAKLQELDARIGQIKAFMLNPNVNPRVWEPDLERAAQQKETTELRLSQLKQASRLLTPSALQAQVSMDPIPLLHQLLEDKEEPWKVSATLRRLLTKFQLTSKPSRYTSVFVLALQPGVTLAEFSDTAILDASEFAYEVIVSTSAHRPVVWTVSGRRL